MSNIEYFDKYILRRANEIVTFVSPEIIIKEYLSDRAYPLELRLALVQQLMPNENLPKTLVEMVENLSNPD